jgi:type II secretory pathway pseudopilin PulG
MENKEDIDDLILKSTITERKRLSVNAEQLEVMLRAIEQLQAEDDNPPSLLKISNRVKRDNGAQWFEENGLMMAKFAISALYWTNKVYASRCYTYFSKEKYTSEFETH